MAVRISLQGSPARAVWSAGRIAGLVLAFGLILAASAFSYRAQSELLAAEQAVERSHQALYQMERLLSGVKDIGNGLRSHIATGEPQYLEVSNAAIEATPALLSGLKLLIADDPDQMQRFDALRQQIDRRVARVNELVAKGRIEGVLRNVRPAREGRKAVSR